ncbi:MAG: cytochrome b6-f complex subunit 7 [Synechococcales cyanobacterium CRU_2_2]|nr:cytochrome b6-f complex subunit 7 [Synechococcales cyanobacterium CRU_2_2]
MGGEIFRTAAVFFFIIPLGLFLGAALLKIQGVEKE